MTSGRLPNAIIGGTEKAGTTSVFDWLATHPEVCASSRKETDFFREQYTGDLTIDARRYAAYFERCDRDVPVRLEASPGYLGEAATVAPRMRALVPQAKLLFILRDPVDRLYSSYHFHRGRLNLPADLSFDDYVERCLAFDRRTRPAETLGLGEWYLKVLRFGCYAEAIESFRAEFPAEQVKVTFFERLSEDPRAFMGDVSTYLGIDPGYWDTFAFAKSNVTFSGRHAGLHKLALRMNTALEPALRRHPHLKRPIVRLYKTLNQQREGYEPMSGAVRARLEDYYRPGVTALERRLGLQLPDSWRHFGGRTVSA